MAFRSTSYWKCLSSRLRGSATYATWTTLKLKAYAPTASSHHIHDHHQQTKPRPVKGEFVPVCVVMGMIALSVGLGLATAEHHLFYSPDVRVKKKDRETLLEVEDPDKVLDRAVKLSKKSFFRKVAHVQEFDNSKHAIPDPIRGDAYAYKPHAETLKSVGIDPKKH